MAEAADLEHAAEIRRADVRVLVGRVAIGLRVLSVQNDVRFSGGNNVDRRTVVGETKPAADVDRRRVSVGVAISVKRLNRDGQTDLSVADEFDVVFISGRGLALRMID